VAFITDAPGVGGGPGGMWRPAGTGRAPAASPGPVVVSSRRDGTGLYFSNTIFFISENDGAVSW
jgi:hypothetical protein